MPTDKQNVEFLYSIIKQLEVKHINWPLIADTNTIPNGHAARMRFHRLRQAMEGTAPRPRIAKDPDDKKTIKSQLKRKAKDEAGTKLKKKLAELEPSDDEDDEDGVPLASVSKRMRLKREEADRGSGDEYVDESEVIKKEEESFGYEDYPVVKREVDDGDYDVHVKQEVGEGMSGNHVAARQEDLAQAETDTIMADGVKQEPDAAQDHDTVFGGELTQHQDSAQAFG